MGNPTEGDSAALPVQERLPSDNQFLPRRGRTPSPPWKNRILVVDPNQGTVEVQSKQLVTNNPSEYTKVPLPSRKNKVVIFVDPETETKPTMDEKTPDGHSTVLLAKFNLDRLPGVYNQILRKFGKMSSLYIRNIEPWSETSSLSGTPAISNHSGQ